MIKNILAIRNDRFGEFLLIIPALAALKESFPGAKITLAVSPYVKELAGCVEYADEIIVWENKRHTLREVFSFGIKLKKRKFDLAVTFNPSKEAHLISFLAGIPKRVGYNRKWGILLTHKLKDTKHLSNRHEVDCNLELVNLVGTKALNKTLKIKVDDNLTSEFVVHEDWGQSPSGTVPFLLVAIHPFTSDAVKQWPVERFRELAQRITQEIKAKVVLVGKDENQGQSPATEGSPERSRGTGTVPSGIIDLINKTSLVELAGVLKQCKLLVTCDSGPMHLSAAVGTPVVALFRNDLPGKTARRWGPWGEGHTVIEKASLADISVEEVFEKVKQGLFHPPLAGSQ